MTRLHWSVLWSLALGVILPALVTAGYLWTRAADQFASRVGFSIRQSSVSEGGLLGGIAGLAGMSRLSGNTADDAAILDEYLRSHDLVAAIDADLDLRALWTRPGSRVDPVFTYTGSGAIEDLQRYWERMVRVRRDGSTGLISVQARAFDPHDARAIARAIFATGSDEINRLSAIAQADTIRLAQLDLDEAEARLATAHAALTEFRNRNQIVDPALGLQGQMGLLSTLQEQLARALINHDLLAGTTRADDPRLTRLSREVEVIKARIDSEKAKLGLGGAGGAADVYATLIGSYERLSIERNFAEQAYIAARTAFDRARGEARRQSRYLAAHVPPTLAETAEYPRRLRILVLVAGFLFLGWSLAVLTWISLRDRR